MKMKLWYLTKTQIFHSLICGMALLDREQLMAQKDSSYSDKEKKWKLKGAKVYMNSQYFQLITIIKVVTAEVEGKNAILR